MRRLQQILEPMEIDQRRLIAVRGTTFDRG